MTSHWKEKSEQNITATNKLITESCFASSVHCCYYSCIQMLYHILSTHFEKSESEIEKESFLGGKEDGGLHIWLINTIIKEFSSINAFEANSFSAKMAGLKRMRTQSDYKNVYINDDSAGKARKAALETLKLLKKNFKI